MSQTSGMRDEFQLNNKRMQLLRLLTYFKPHLALLGLCAFVSILGIATTLAKPYIIKYVIDDYLKAGHIIIGGIQMLGALYFAMVFMGAGFSYIQSYFMTFIGQKIMFKIRNQLFEHVQQMSMRFFDKNSSGRILTRITNDVEGLNEVFSGILINIIRDFMMIIGTIIAMLSMDVKLGLIAISSIPLIAVITVFYRFAARKNFIKMKGMIAKINGFLAENISGMRIIQIFHREKEKYEEQQGLERIYYKSSLREVVLNSLCRPIVDIINNLTIAIIIWYCTKRFIDQTLAIGVLYAFITYIKQIFEPISSIAEQYTTIQSAFISSERVFDILDSNEEHEDLNTGLPIKKLKGDIEFSHVWFAYNDENWVLKDVSFKINSGELIAFVGATGSGKSTIINLMARFYDIQKGEILIDGVDIRKYRIHDLRRQISVVLQDVFLFTGSIKSNIRLKNTDITDEQIQASAESASAEPFINSLPNGYDEEVKERGCTFSAGQKQLISFARAIAFAPSILVLDEATANIDTQTESYIQKAMSTICKGKTSIVIAHRLSTIKNADKIIVLHNGRIKEIGSHSSLLAHNGLYSEMCKQA